MMPVDVASALLEQFHQLVASWFTTIQPYTTFFFWALVTTEFCWWVLERLHIRALSEFFLPLILKIAAIGISAYLLEHAGSWVPDVIDSFTILGFKAAGLANPISAGDVFITGINLAGQMFGIGVGTGWVFSWGPGIALACTSLLTFLAFIVLTVTFIWSYAMSYITTGIGAVMLMFLGSRWTMDYGMRFISLVIGCGVRVMVVQILLGASMAFSRTLIDMAANLAVSTSPYKGALAICGAALMMATVVWHLPNFVASMLGGSPSFGAMEPVHLAGSLSSAAISAMMTSRMIAGMAAGGHSSGGSNGSGAGAASSGGSAGNGHSRKAVTGLRP